MNFLYILLALIVLLVMITVHEFGHFCAGKILGFKINEFAIGFGPAIFKRKSKKTDEQFSIRLLPLGGFCAFEGEDEAGNEKPGAFNTMPAWKRLIVLLSGVAFNFLFGVLTAAIYLMVSGFSTVKVTATVNQQGVSTAGFQKNDIVVSVNGKTVEAYRSFSDMLKEFKAGEEFEVIVNRDGKLETITTKKQSFPAFYFVSNAQHFEGKLFNESGEKISIEEFSIKIIECSTVDESSDETKGSGLALKTYLSGVFEDKEHTKSYANDETLKDLLKSDPENDKYAVIGYAKAGVGVGVIQQTVAQKYGFFESIGKAWPFCFYLCGMIISSFAGLFTGAVAVKEAGGTITAISQIAQISQQGIMYFLLLLPLLAMNLAVFNILPIPALDGARCVFVLIEMIFRKPVPRKVEGWIHTIGLFLLLGLVVILDINHFIFASTFLLL